MKNMINSKGEAIDILKTQKFGIPYNAIQYLYNSETSKLLVDEIIYALNHVSDGTYYDVDSSVFLNTSLWYAIIAENHINKDMIDSVINLYSCTYDDNTMMNEQGMYLITLLAEKYPNIVVEKVIKEIDRLVNVDSHHAYLFLFDVFFYADLNKYKSWILSNILKEKFYWRVAFVSHIAAMQIKEAIPLVKDLLNEVDDGFDKVDLQRSLDILETGIFEYPDSTLPYHKKRGNWKMHYKNFEEFFIDDNDILECGIDSERGIGRNESCPCESGKKYKKCCINK